MLNLVKKKQSHSKKECCLALILKENEGSVIALTIDKVNQSLNKVDEKKITFSSSWDLISESVDDVLFQLEHDNNCSIKEVIFFLYAHIVDQKSKKIKPVYFQHIKNIIKTLDLKPLGYIDYQEAVSIYFSEKERNALTAMIVEIDNHKVSLFVYQNGVLVFSESMEGNDVLTTDLEKLFASAKGFVLLPSRIFIYDSYSSEEKIETIIAHQWSDNLFVQIPQFEILSEDRLATILFFAFNEQLFEKKGGEEAIQETPSTVLGFSRGKDSDEEVFEQKTHPFTFISPVIKTFTHMINGVRFKSRILSFFFALLAILLIGLSVALYFFHTAHIVIAIQSKLIEKQLDIDGTVGEPSAKTILKINTSETTVEKNESTNTTGKITIGEKAKGEITIYNLLEEEKIFKKNTIFITDKNIQFLLDDDVKLASASTTFTSDGNKLIVTGKSKSSLTAKNIGIEGNIDKDQKLRIEDFPSSSYFASPLNSFSGGSKKDVQTVSKDDLKKLKDSLLIQMKSEKETLTKDLPKSTRIIDQLTTVKIVDETYSKELGEEAKNVSLNAKGLVSFYSYDVDDMKKIILDISSHFIPTGYHVPANNIEYVISDARGDDTKKIILSLDVKERSVMRLAENQIVQEIKGRGVDTLSKTLNEKYKIQDYTVEVTSFFPFLTSRLPFFTKNIKLTIKSQ